MRHRESIADAALCDAMGHEEIGQDRLRDVELSRSCSAVGFDERAVTRVHDLCS